MKRRSFAAMAAGAFVGFPRIARATGGIDVANSEAKTTIRVLLATDDFEAPQTLDAWHFSWNAKTYRGAFIVSPLPDGRRALVNVLPLDAYLAGVISSEMPPSWPDAAQRAQAIVSRTYVLSRLRADRAYDVTADESDQKYSGIERESVYGKAGVDATAGDILMFGGVPAHVAYSSCCGGATAAAGDVWNTPYPYLPSTPDPNCSDAPGFAWSASVARNDLARAFGAQLGKAGALRSVDVLGEPDLRPTSIVFEGASSQYATTPNAFRSALGYGVIRSTYVRSASLNATGDLVVNGTGHGHGVGLCQWGAHGMAVTGATEAAILSFYFPGTSVSAAV